MCPNNEEFLLYGKCEGSCTEPMEKCTYTGSAGCYCKPNYVRYNENCIRLGECPGKFINGYL